MHLGYDAIALLDGAYTNQARCVGGRISEARKMIKVMTTNNTTPRPVHSTFDLKPSDPLSHGMHHRFTNLCTHYKAFQCIAVPLAPHGAFPRISGSLNYMREYQGYAAAYRSCAKAANRVGGYSFMHSHPFVLPKEHVFVCIVMRSPPAHHILLSKTRQAKADHRSPTNVTIERHCQEDDMPTHLVPISDLSGITFGIDSGLANGNVDTAAATIKLTKVRFAR